jgi:hypothetical protein
LLAHSQKGEPTAAHTNSLTSKVRDESRNDDMRRVHAALTAILVFMCPRAPLVFGKSPRTK